MTDNANTDRRSSSVFWLFVLLSAIAKLVGTVGGVVDEFVTTDEERLQVKSTLLTLQIQAVENALDFERAQLEARAKIVEAEAKSENWLTSSWRPLTMLTFVAVIVLAQFGIGPAVPEPMWPLLQLGLGGYVVGRSAEKIIPGVVQALKAREEA